MAGMTALCTANPYPVLTIGDGVNDPEKNIKKSIRDYENVMTNNLNPTFFRIYELDANFPNDWKLKIDIMD